MVDPPKGLCLILKNKIPSTNPTARYYKLEAEKLQLKIVPQKHSNRISCATTLKSLGASDEDIKIHMHWASETMSSYYTKDFLLTEPNAPAHLLAKALQSGSLDEAQDHICD